jgi:hypothetical protein
MTPEGRSLRRSTNRQRHDRRDCSRSFVLHTCPALTLLPVCLSVASAALPCPALADPPAALVCLLIGAAYTPLATDRWS